MIDLVAVANAAFSARPPWSGPRVGGRYQRSGAVALSSFPLPGPSFNYAIVFDPDVSLEEVMALARPFFGDVPEGFGVLVQADAGQRAEREALALGWPIAEEEPAMVWADPQPGPPKSKGLEIVKVATAAELEEFRVTTALGFAAPREMIEAFAGDGCQDDEDVVFLLGRDETGPVTAGSVGLMGGAAIVWGVTTIPKARGRGHGRAIVEEAVRHGARAGARHAAIKWGPLSRPLYERIGFVTACWHRTFLAQPESS